MDFKYDVIVIGAGHAGCEAAAAAANMGSKTCLITMDMNKIGQMSCNPAVGGIAKGQIVREIDALGGYMGLVTDRTAIQFRMLNRSKGPAMWSPRAQCDRGKFIWAWREILENTPNLHIWQDTVEELIVENGEATGVMTCWGVTFHAKCIVLTAGTFLNGLMHIGHKQLAGGRMAEPASYHLTESITHHGITAGRMKTGTPVRIDGRSVHYELMETQDGENDFHRFSFMSEPRKLKQLFSIYSKVVIPLLGKLLSKDNSAYRYLPDTIKVFPQGEVMKGVIARAGFSEVNFKRLTFGICTLYTATK